MSLFALMPWMAAKVLNAPGTGRLRRTHHFVFVQSANLKRKAIF